MLGFRQRKHGPDHLREPTWLQLVGRGHSPGHLHEGEGHGCGVDGQVPVQVDDDAEVEQVDPHWKQQSRRSGSQPAFLTTVACSPSGVGKAFPEPCLSFRLPTP